jgi:exonuclease III
VITYNIWNGFNQMSRYDNNDTLRKQKFIEWTRRQEADVVALQELVGFSTDKLHDLGLQIGLPNTLLLKSSGYPVGLASKHPIELIERKIKGMHHGFLHCQVQDIHFFVVHFSPGSYKMRRNEADSILQRINRDVSPDGEILVLGDFNAVSPYDSSYLNRHPAVRERYLRGDRNKMPGEGNLADQTFDFQVLYKFYEKGFRDLVYQNDPRDYCRISFPTPALAPGAEWNERGHRIDYILANPEMEKHCIRAVIPHSEFTKKISDHFPVVAEFERNTKSMKE